MKHNTESGPIKYMSHHRLKLTPLDKPKNQKITNEKLAHKSTSRKAENT